MTIILTGGGSGGHITPLLAVARELKRARPDVRLVYVGQKGDRLGDIVGQNEYIDQTYWVRAGKFRRYHGEGLKQLFDVPTVLKNVRDAVYVLIGLTQSYRLIGKVKPAIVFSRGGYVSVPVSLAGALRGVPYFTHDSDSVPSLANRIIARWATVHAVGMPKELYRYPQHKTHYTGIPIDERYQPVTPELQSQFKAVIGVEPARPVLFVTGGGNGAQRLNMAVLAIAPELMSRIAGLEIIHAAGRALEGDLREAYNKTLPGAEQRSRVQIHGFISDMYRYSGAADVIVARSGATAIAEFSAQHKPCVFVPNPQLTGGHQSKNVQHLVEQGAARVVTESELHADGKALLPVLLELFENEAGRRALGDKLGALARTDAAATLAELILQQAERVGE